MQETEATGLGERWSLLSRAFFFLLLLDCEACEDQLTTHDTSVVACGHLVNNQTSLVQSASSESHEDSRFRRRFTRSILASKRSHPCRQLEVPSWMSPNRFG
ncbi:hypothetical protein D6D12_03860 [Aureobasidium pullulans]|uniref:Secreted protein n=1 Tax=Aureobasidium pullulans TaxID=5580 RepID=A0AB74JXP6_AURPU|nr:hypothetical protein D6D12_03860 [Aureobasidium pullulans]